jgi:hypothetical protein
VRGSTKSMKQNSTNWMVIALLWLASAQTGWCFYNPSTGRWLSRDPIAEKGGLNLYGFTQNGPVNRMDYLGKTWTWKANDLGDRPPEPGNGGDVTGRTTATKWEVRTKLRPCPCGYKVQADGDAVVEFWSSSLESWVHEMHHVNIYNRAWSDTEWAVYPYELKCVSAKKAACYQNLITAIRNYYLAPAELENNFYDYNEYGGGNPIEAIIDEMIWAAILGQMEDQCDAIP